MRPRLTGVQTEYLAQVERWFKWLITWLSLARDHCRCKKCVNQDTSQRAFDTFQVQLWAFFNSRGWLSKDLTGGHAKPGCHSERGPTSYMYAKLIIFCFLSWLSAGMNDGISDGHVSLYPWEWLVKNISTKRWYEEQQKISDLKYISRTPAFDQCWSWKNFLGPWYLFFSAVSTLRRDNGRRRRSG